MVMRDVLPICRNNFDRNYLQSRCITKIAFNETFYLDVNLAFTNLFILNNFYIILTWISHKEKMSATI